MEDVNKPSFGYLLHTYGNVLRISKNYIGKNQIRYRIKPEIRTIGLWISKAEAEKKLLSFHHEVLDRNETQRTKELQCLEDAFGPC